MVKKVKITRVFPFPLLNGETTTAEAVSGWTSRYDSEKDLFRIAGQAIAEKVLEAKKSEKYIFPGAIVEIYVIK